MIDEVKNTHRFFWLNLAPTVLPLFLFLLLPSIPTHRQSSSILTTIKTSQSPTNFFLFSYFDSLVQQLLTQTKSTVAFYSSSLLLSPLPVLFISENGQGLLLCSPLSRCGRFDRRRPRPCWSVQASRCLPHSRMCLPPRQVTITFTRASTSSPPASFDIFHTAQLNTIFYACVHLPL